MRLKFSLDIAQAARGNVLAGIGGAGVYVDAFGACLSSWEHHIKLLQTVLPVLHENALKLIHLSAYGQWKKPIIDICLGV